MQLTNQEINEVSWWQRIKEANDEFDSIEQLTITISMFLITIMRSTIMPISMGVASYVEHHRVTDTIAPFLGDHIAFWASMFVVGLLMTIPVITVFDRLNHGTLSFEKNTKMYISGFTLVKIARWVRFFLGLWSEFSYVDGNGDTHVVWDKLEIGEKESKTALEKFEFFLIVGVLFLVFVGSMEFEGQLIVETDTDMWAIGFYKLFTQSNMWNFFPVLKITLLTGITTYGLTRVSHEVAMTVAKSIVERKAVKTERFEAKAQAVREMEEQNIMSVIDTSTLGKFWVNLQKIKGINVTKDLIDTTKNAYRFYDFLEDKWSGEYKSRQGFRQGIAKIVGER